VTPAIGDDLHARDELFVARTLDRLAPAIERLWSPRAEGAEHLARGGAALVVGNHSGGVLAMLEPLVLAHAVRGAVGTTRLPHLLLHEVMWRSPAAPVVARLGAVRASEPNATALLSRGRPVLVYPGGDREAFRSFFDRDRVQLGDRRGYLRLALRAGAPIVPVVTAGFHSGHVTLHDGHPLAQRLPLARSLRVGVLPLTFSLPFGLTFGAPPPYLPMSRRVRIRVLPPIRFTRAGEAAANDVAYVEACHRIVSGAMQYALDELSRVRRLERRRDLHDALDGALDRLDRWTGAGIAIPSLRPTLRRAA
jgi:1-acyl-sn-glycerol-3-phosphate acyltransferase